MCSNWPPPTAAALVQSYGVTFQNGALISSLTVAQNIQLPLREYYPASEKTLDELAELNLALVGLAGGRRPKVSRAACPAAWSSAPRWPGRSASNPSCLFLDEPTAGLDPISAAAFDELLLYLHSQLRLTVVMITHDLDTLFRTCSRVGVIVDGRMITGTPGRPAAESESVDTRVFSRTAGAAQPVKDAHG